MKFRTLCNEKLIIEECEGEDEIKRAINKKYKYPIESIVIYNDFIFFYGNNKIKTLEKEERKEKENLLKEEDILEGKKYLMGENTNSTEEICDRIIGNMTEYINQLI